VTITARRRINWTLFAAACLCLAAAAVHTLPFLLGRADASHLEDSESILAFELLGWKLLSPGFVAVGSLLAGLYAVLCLGFILYSFRKTVSSEMFFFSFWVLSLGFETGRLVVFRLAEAGMTAEATLTATRVVLAARFTGILAIFASSLYAAGFRNEKLGTVLILILAVGAGLAWAMPLNTGVYDPTFLVRPGYVRITGLLGAIAAIATTIDFLYAARSTGERSYRVIALGAAAALLGQGILVSQWHPLALLLGFALLLAGSWLFVSRLHAYYLWQ